MFLSFLIYYFQDLLCEYQTYRNIIFFCIFKVYIFLGTFPCKFRSCPHTLKILFAYLVKIKSIMQKQCDENIEEIIPVCEISHILWLKLSFLLIMLYRCRAHSSYLGGFVTVGFGSYFSFWSQLAFCCFVQPPC